MRGSGRGTTACLLAGALLVAGCGGAGGGETGARQAADDTAAAPAPAEFAAELGVDLSEMRRTESGLYVQDLEEGTGLAARPGHVVAVHYTGWLPNGERFDTSRDGDGEPYTFQLGSRQVIPGWEEGVTGMRIGGVRKLVVPPALAYGARGVPGAIPPNATLVFEVELLDIRM